MKRDPPTEKAVPMLRLSFAEFALQLASRKVREEVRYIIQLVSGAVFDAEDHRRHVNRGLGLTATVGKLLG